MVRHDNHQKTTPPTHHKIKLHEKNKNRAILRKQKLLVYISKAQKSFQVQPQPKDSPKGPEKDQNDFKKAENKKLSLYMSTPQKYISGLT